MTDFCVERVGGNVGDRQNYPPSQPSSILTRLPGWHSLCQLSQIGIF